MKSTHWIIISKRCDEISSDYITSDYKEKYSSPIQFSSSMCASNSECKVFHLIGFISLPLSFKQSWKWNDFFSKTHLLLQPTDAVFGLPIMQAIGSETLVLRAFIVNYFTIWVYKPWALLNLILQWTRCMIAIIFWAHTDPLHWQLSKMKVHVLKVAGCAVSLAWVPFFFWTTATQFLRSSFRVNGFVPHSVVGEPARLQLTDTSACMSIIYTLYLSICIGMSDLIIVHALKALPISSHSRAPSNGICQQGSF